MPDYGERPAEQNERRLETASCRDLPSNNYGIRMLERTLPSQQQHQYLHQQQSGGRKTTGGIMRLANYRGWTVNIRAPKWKDNQFWISCEDLEAAQYIADAAYYFTGRPPVHFPDANFVYLPLLLSTGERLTTREKCSAHLAKIAKDPALNDRRKDFRDRAQKLILEMVKTPNVVHFLNTRRASPGQAWQPRPEPTLEDTDSPFTEGENGMATPSEEAIEASASTVPVNPYEYGNLVPAAEETRSVIADDDGEHPGSPMEVDGVSEEAIQALVPTVTVDPTVLQFDSTWPNFDMDVDLWTSFIPSFEMDPYESYLTSAGQSLGIWHPHFGEKGKEKEEEKEEEEVPDNYKEFLSLLDRDEEEARKLTEPSDWELWPESSPTIWPTFAASGSYSSRIPMAESRHYLRYGCPRSFATPCEAHFVSEQMEGLRHSGDGSMPCERITIP